MANDLLKPVELDDEPAHPEKVVARAVEFFEDDEKTALDWLNRPHRAFNWKTPFEIARQNKKGAGIVLLLIDRMEHGFFD